VTRNRMMNLFCVAAGICLLAAGRGEPLVSVPDPSAALQPETSQQRQLRHEKVAKARAGTAIILHRGAAESAPDNTLAAIRIALAMGCQGVELDFRRTRDGAIVLFHDDRLEYRTDGFGSVEEFDYEELLLYTRRDWPPAAGRPFPTLRDVLQALRDGAGLVILDIKTPGIDAELLQSLRRADMLDHVVGYSQSNAGAFAAAGIRQLPMKGSLIGQRLDMDPGEVERLLDRPGNIVFLDDPRADLELQGRGGRAVPCGAGVSPAPINAGGMPAPQLAAALRAQSAELPVRLAAVRLAIADPAQLVKLAPELARGGTKEARRALVWNLGMIAKHRPALLDDGGRALLLEVLCEADASMRAEAAVACARARLKAAIPVIVDLLGQLASRSPAPSSATVADAKGHLAYALGLFGRRDPGVVDVLLRTFRHRQADPRRMWMGVDGAMAAWALGELRAGEAVGPLGEALFWRLPAGAKEPDDDEPSPWPVHWDLQVPRFIPRALAAIGTPQSLEVLEIAAKLPPTEAAARSPELLPAVGEALARFPAEDRPALLEKLVLHAAPQVRGAAVLACLREPGLQYRAILAKHAAWAVPWWDAEHRGERGERKGEGR
jgi:hypothetical protein